LSDLIINSTDLSVGIVTRTKNRIVLLRRALESVKNQSHENWILVIVNDGGDPAPVDRLVASIFNTDSRVRIIHHPESKGMEAASNAGISALDTDYAIIHDDDDSWAPEFLKVTTQTLIEKQKKFPSIRGIVTQLNSVFETVTANLIEIDRVEPWYAGQFDHLEEGFLSVQKMLVRNQFPPIAFLFNLSICKELGMFDSSLPVLGDWDFHTRFVLRHDIWVHPEYLAFYHHRTTATGAMGNTIHAGAHMHRAYRQILRNKWIRADLNGASGSNRMAMIIGMEIQDEIKTEFHQLNANIHAYNYHRSNYKSPFRQAISNGVRKLKYIIKGKKNV
jgi:glycosyltransferase involved in cell wall biosynthesis